MPDPRRDVIHVVQGQFHVSDRPEHELTTVLGSCVAACLFDPERKIGGMNHFLLPGSDPRAGRNIKYGAHSMEQLINAMLRLGAQRHRIEARLFGGANVVRGLARIGDSNSAFARDFVRQEGFILREAELGGTTGQRVRFLPASGRTRMQRLDPALHKLPATEARPTRRATTTGSVELF
jgi:chemotaxis protein CheD